MLLQRRSLLILGAVGVYLGLVVASTGLPPLLILVWVILLSGALGYWYWFPRVPPVSPHQGIGEGTATLIPWVAVVCGLALSMRVIVLPLYTGFGWPAWMDWMDWGGWSYVVLSAPLVVAGLYVGAASRTTTIEKKMVLLNSSLMCLVIVLSVEMEREVVTGPNLLIFLFGVISAGFYAGLVGRTNVSAIWACVVAAVSASVFNAVFIWGIVNPHPVSGILLVMLYYVSSTTVLVSVGAVSALIIRRAWGYVVGGGLQQPTSQTP